MTNIENFSNSNFSNKKRLCYFVQFCFLKSTIAIQSFSTVNQFNYSMTMESQTLRNRSLMRFMNTFNSNDHWYWTALKLITLIIVFAFLIFSFIFCVHVQKDNLSIVKIICYIFVALMFVLLNGNCFLLMFFDLFLLLLLLLVAAGLSIVLSWNISTIYLPFCVIPLIFKIMINPSEHFNIIKQLNMKLSQNRNSSSNKNTSIKDDQVSVLFVNSNIDNIQFIIKPTKFELNSDFNNRQSNNFESTTVDQPLPVFGFHQPENFKNSKTQLLEHLDPSSFLQHPELV